MDAGQGAAPVLGRSASHLCWPEPSRLLADGPAPCCSVAVVVDFSGSRERARERHLPRRPRARAGKQESDARRGAAADRGRRDGAAGLYRRRGRAEGRQDQAQRGAGTSAADLGGGGDPQARGTDHRLATPQGSAHGPAQVHERSRPHRARLSQANRAPPHPALVHCAASHHRPSPDLSASFDCRT